MTTNRSVPRMRTVPNAYREIKSLDENTELTERGLRRLIQKGKVPTVSIGNKQLINLDVLIDILNGYETTCVSISA